MEQLRIGEEDRAPFFFYYFCKYQLNIHLFNLSHSLFVCHVSLISAMKRNKRSMYKWSIAALGEVGSYITKVNQSIVVKLNPTHSPNSYHG
jgi:hypothetical protein